MESFLERITRLPHKKLALLATELYERSRLGAAEPIAITAMACRFPGAGDTPEAFWSFLDRGGDAIEPVPVDRLAMIGRSAAEATSRGPIWGGFLSQIDGFDPAAFGISPKEAEMMDPQQRLLLEVTWEALENAGTPLDNVDSETGVFIGVSGFDFALIGAEADLEPNGYMLTGAAHCVIAGRLSYVFGLNGPSTVLDTACAAAASAVHLGCQSLRAGECSQVIAGGINLLLNPEIAHLLGVMQVLARDGRCKVFSADADGFVRAEGCGVIVLRRLSDALVRRDPILGVIRGTAWNQDGKSGGMTAPNGAAQERVIRAALADARLSPDQISYIEAHGTGTALGDPIELSALGRVFATETRATPLIVGSVKANIGHLEAAAGMAGLIKVLLALRHEKIPRHLHATNLNSRIDWTKLPLRVPTHGAEWPKTTAPRVGGVSAFGISGTNVHMVISEPPPEVEEKILPSRSCAVLTLSAKSRDALQALAGRYAAALAERRDVDIVAFAAAANLKRAHFAHRLAVLASDACGVELALRRFSQGDADCGVRSVFIAGHRPLQLGMLFENCAPPDVSQLSPMFEEPVFRAAYDEWLSLIPEPSPSHTSLIVGFQIALAALWRSWGIRPVLAVGEGCGEVAAAVAAGGLSLRDAAALTRSIDARSAVPAIASRELTVPLIVGSMGERVAGRPLSPECISSLGRTPGRGAALQQAQVMVERMILVQPADSERLLAELAEIYLAGGAIDWSAVHAGQRIDAELLPNYPFQRERFWPVQFTRTVSHRRGRSEISDDVPNDGIYHVEWRPIGLADTMKSTGSRPATVYVLHRDAVDAVAACSALRAASLGVQDVPIPNGPLSRSVLEALAETRDSTWVYLVPSGAGRDDPAGEARVDLEDVLVIAQVVLEIGPAAPALCVVTMGTQSVHSTVRPTAAMVWGLGRVLAAEAPDARVSFVELDAAVPDWDGLRDFIASGSSEPELAIVNGRVLTPALGPVALPAPSNEPQASELASYLVTGAFGFIGGLTTRWLVEQGAGKLFLVGHNPPRGEALAAIEAARKTGTEIEAITLDISDAADVEMLFKRIEADPRPLKGIIHSAAALDDASISRQTPASLSRALGAKARGAWLLHERSSVHSLDFFVLYSSAAAVLGTPGQANYAAANCYLDALAHHRRDSGLTALSLNWGLWERTGLAVKRDVVQAASTQGVIPISAASGMAILGRAIRSGETQVSVLPFDWVLLRQALGARRPPTLLQSLVVDKGGGAAPGEADGGVLTRYAKLFETASASERSDLLLEFTRSRSCELVGLDPTTAITDDQPLLDLGIDSLTGLELRNNLQTLAGVTFPSTLFFDCPTFGDLGRYFQLIGSAKDRLRSNGSEQEFERISI